MADRTRARQLAAEYIARGEPTGWFEQLYQEAERGEATVSWADLSVNSNLLEFWNTHPENADGKSALKIGCGLGDDAEQLARWGLETTAFDIAPSAIRACRRRFPETRVHYEVADLLDPPSDWLGRFEFVLESYTLQVLPRALRVQAIRCVAGFVKPGGRLLVSARARTETEPEGDMPWPLTNRELDCFSQNSLSEVSRDDYLDQESPPVRRFRALFRRPNY